jgi:hypothetical protein
MTLSSLTLLIMLYQISKGPEINSLVDNFKRHPQRCDDPKQGIHRHICTSLKVDDRFAVTVSLAGKVRSALGHLDGFN